MPRNIITAIDAGTSSIKVIIAEEKKNSKEFEILGVCKRESRGIRRGYAANPEEVAESVRSAVKEAERAAGVLVKHSFLAIGGIGLSSSKAKSSITVSRADGKITSYDIEKVLSQAEASFENSSNREILHRFPLQFKVDNMKIEGSPEGFTGSKLEAEIFFVTCLKQHLLGMVSAVEKAGIEIDDITASPLAASYSVLDSRQKEAGCILANIGAGTVSIIVYEESKPISLEVFPIGSTHITNDIALGMQVPLDEAEKLKISFGSPSSPAQKQLSNIIEARVNDIFELIENHLKKIGRNNLLPAGIILTGGGSNLISLEEMAKASLRIPAKEGIPLDPKNHNHIKISGAAKDKVVNNPEWSVALGLCVKEVFEKENSRSAFLEKKGFEDVKRFFKKIFNPFIP